VSENVSEFTTSDFEAEVLKSDLPVLVDFGQNGVAPVEQLLQ